MRGEFQRAGEIETRLGRELERVRSALKSQQPESAASLDPEATAAREVREPLAPSSPAAGPDAAREDAAAVTTLIDRTRCRGLRRR
jgi:hypothetical protein